MKLFEEPAEQQRSYAELREEFRAAHLADLRARFGQPHRLGWNQILDDLPRSFFTSDGWAKEMLRHLDAPVAQDFGLKAAPPTLGMKLEDQAQAALKHDQVTWADNVEGVIDHDAAPLADLKTLSDDDLADYVAQEITKSGADR